MDEGVRMIAKIQEVAVHKTAGRALLTNRVLIGN